METTKRHRNAKPTRMNRELNQRIREFVDYQEDKLNEGEPLYTPRLQEMANFWKEEAGRLEDIAFRFEKGPKVVPKKQEATVKPVESQIELAVRKILEKHLGTKLPEIVVKRGRGRPRKLQAIS